MSKIVVDDQKVREQEQDLKEFYAGAELIGQDGRVLKPKLTRDASPDPDGDSTV